MNVRLESFSLEDIVETKLEHFFGRLGKTEVRKLHVAVIDQVERALIRITLKHSDQNKLKTSRMLGLSRNTLDKKIKSLKIKAKA